MLPLLEERIYLRSNVLHFADYPESDVSLSFSFLPDNFRYDTFQYIFCYLPVNLR